MEAAKQIDSPAIPRAAQFGKYRLLESIGQGGMADVMVAVMPGPGRFNKLLVLKTIREQVSDGEHYPQMFLDEARLAARLNHQNVVHTYEVGDENGVYYIAMEYLEGRTLGEVQRKLGLDALPLQARLRILVETAHGLHHAHELTDYSGNPLNVVHRDVSPQNIFLTYDGQVKLLDFGIAKMRDAEAVTIVGQVKGKIDYMAPEQLKGDSVDRTADVFALGAIMWEMLAGKPMSGGREISQIARAHNRLAKRETSIRVAMPQLDDDLARICDKALAHDTRERYATALDFARDIEEYFAQLSLMPTSQQLARILQPAFADARKERRLRIDAALAAVEIEQAGLGLPERATPQESGPMLSLPGRLRRSSDTQNITQVTTGTQAQAPNSIPGPVLAPTRPTTLQKVAIVALVTGAAAWFQLSSEVQPKAALAPVQRVESTMQAAVPSPPIAAVEAPALIAQTVKLTVRSNTPGVRVLLDGALIPQLPYEADVAIDNAMHRIVASAAGHESVSQVLTLDRDREVTLELPVTAEDASRLPSRSASRHGARVASKAPATALPSPAPERAAGELRPGQEMDRRARSAAEMSDTDPYR